MMDDNGIVVIIHRSTQKTAIAVFGRGLKTAVQFLGRGLKTTVRFLGLILKTALQFLSQILKTAIAVFLCGFLATCGVWPRVHHS